MKLKLSTLVFLFFFSVMISQEKVSFTYKNTPLNKVLADIEKEFDVKFSFDSDLIVNLVLNYSEKEVILPEILKVIESQTGFEIQQVSDRYYNIRHKKELVDLSKTQGLDEVFITEYLTSGIKKNRDGSIVLTPKSLGILPGLTEPDVLQSLQLLSGIHSPNETATELYVRGGTPDQNLILWDDIKIYNSGHFFGTISAFNPYIIKDVKLFTSGTKAKYGNRISSVIDISSDSNIPEKIEGGFGFNMTHADLYIKAPVTKKLGLIISTRRSYTDLINTFTFQKLSDRVFQNTKISDGNAFLEDDPITITKDFFKFSDLTAKIIYEPTTNDEVVLSSLFTKNKLDYEFFNENFRDTSTDQLDVENKGLSIKWNHRYNSNFWQSIKGYKSYYNLEYEGHNQYEQGFHDNYMKKNDIDDYGLMLNNEWKLNEKNSLNFGYDFSSNSVSYTFDYTTNSIEFDDFGISGSGVNNIHAAYAEYQYEDEDRWFFNIGLRANKTSYLDEFYVEPRFHFETKLNSNVKLKLSGEHLHQTIIQIEELISNNFGLETELWVLVAQDLPLLQSKQISVGMNFKKGGWNLDLDVYAKKVKGLNSFSRGFNSVRFFSLGESNILGMDFLLKKKIDNYRTWLGYSIIRNEYTFEGINGEEPFFANFNITNQINWSHSYNWNKLSFSLGWNYRTGIPYTKGLGLMSDDETIEYGKINGERLPNYHRLDFSTTYKFNFSKDEKWKGKIGLSIFNIYDKKNILSRTYRVIYGEDENMLREIEKRSLGITPNLVFRVEF